MPGSRAPPTGPWGRCRGAARVGAPVVLGMVIGMALGWSDLQTVALAVGLAFLFGYAFTIGPVMRSGLSLRAAVPVALAADTVSITVMEVVDNAVMLAVPGAMEAGLTSVLFWGSLAFALAVAFVVTVPVNRWLIARGRGHAVVHQFHGGHETGSHPEHSAHYAGIRGPGARAARAVTTPPAPYRSAGCCGTAGRQAVTTVSAEVAPRSPIGWSGPSVVSLAVCRSASAFTSAPSRMMYDVRYSQSSSTTTPASAPYVFP
jgi:hypothetical protein